MISVISGAQTILLILEGNAKWPHILVYFPLVSFYEDNMLPLLRRSLNILGVGPQYRGIKRALEKNFQKTAENVV